MTTQVVRLSPALAVKLAQTADRLGLTHEQVLVEALRGFLTAAKGLGKADVIGGKPSGGRR